MTSRSFLDRIDRKILTQIQRDSSLPIAELARKVGLSASPCWRRLQRLQEIGVIRGRVALLDRKSVGLPVTVFISITATEHSQSWFDQFASAAAEIPEIVELHRMSGDVDYLLKVVVPSIDHYDRVYKRLIAKVELATVTSRFSMEAIKETTALPLTYLEGRGSSD